MIRTLLALIALTCAAVATAADRPIPRIEGRQLVVDGKPWLLLGGELANSSASGRAYMAQRWDRLAALHLNTVLMPVSWELIEPQEDQFDFALVDGLLADARARDLRIVILWFGSWKNSMSSYAPAWVKRDTARFPRARLADGSAIEMLSPFAPANAEADAHAFAALMAHLAETDTERTVIMAQVENEIGMIPEPRDQSPLARVAWGRPVPQGLAGAGKSWTAAYGADADEAFMANAYARYTEQVAAAGKRAYALPMYVNAALPRPGRLPGSGYPAAGPLPKYADIWRTAAPSIDFLAPDIYFPSFVEWTRAYAALGDPWFIPEANRAGAPEAPANALYAIGQLDAFGYSPFSIDNLDPSDDNRLGALYAVLQSLAPQIMAAQGSDRLSGVRAPVLFDGTADLADQVLMMGDARITAHFVDPFTPREEQHPETHGAIVLQTGADDYLMVGRGVTFTFAPARGKGIMGLAAVDDGHIENGRFVADRRLNGDETHQGRHVRLPLDRISIQRVRLYRYD
ncbi:MAG TPA: DUF5597 domain-containing protein [Sphingomonas sp.]|nr:DUF5597 domain-containing protein [Sphingomonas sp.]